jgi:hypothetical protein
VRPWHSPGSGEISSRCLLGLRPSSQPEGGGPSAYRTAAIERKGKERTERKGQGNEGAVDQNWLLARHAVFYLIPRPDRSICIPTNLAGTHLCSIAVASRKSTPIPSRSPGRLRNVPVHQKTRHTYGVVRYCETVGLSRRARQNVNHRFLDQTVNNCPSPACPRL